MCTLFWLKCAPLIDLNVGFKTFALLFYRQNRKGIIFLVFLLFTNNKTLASQIVANFFAFLYSPQSPQSYTEILLYGATILDASTKTHPLANFIQTMRIQHSLIFIIVLFFCGNIFAQSEKNFNSYFQPSNLYKKGQYEVKLFNALYTQGMFDGFSELNSRSTYFSGFGQVLIGTKRNLNYGFDVVYKSNLENDRVGASPFDALLFDEKMDYASTENGALTNSEGEVLNRTARHGLSHIGPKIKFNPIRKWEKVSLQQTAYIPIDQSVDGSWISYTQLMYDRKLSSKTALFAELGFWTTVAPNFRVLPLAKAFLSYFPNNRWTVYAMTTVPVEYGLGTKFLITPNFEVELLYTYYLPLDFILNGNRPTTYNLGFRYTNW